MKTRHTTSSQQNKGGRANARMLPSPVAAQIPGTLVAEPPDENRPRLSDGLIKSSVYGAPGWSREDGSSVGPFIPGEGAGWLSADPGEWSLRDALFWANTFCIVGGVAYHTCSHTYSFTCVISVLCIEIMDNWWYFIWDMCILVMWNSVPGYVTPSVDMFAVMRTGIMWLIIWIRLNCKSGLILIINGDGCNVYVFVIVKMNRSMIVY